jgi:hypothetical protein
MTRATITAFALLLAAAGAGCTVYPAEPTSPTYANDVHPIFMARCARCHGAGGMLRKELINDAESPAGVIQCYLDNYEDRGDCTLNDAGAPPPSCQPGAHTCATAAGYKIFMEMYIHLPESNPRRMPPPPSPPLNEWELKVIDRWIANPLP